MDVHHKTYKTRQNKPSMIIYLNCSLHTASGLGICQLALKDIPCMPQFNWDTSLWTQRGERRTPRTPPKKLIQAQGSFALFKIHVETDSTKYGHTDTDSITDNVRDRVHWNKNWSKFFKGHFLPHRLEGDMTSSSRYLRPTDFMHQVIVLYW